MRTLVVEDLEELVEPSLLLQEISTRWLGGFFLQSAMHTFVTAVLLRMAGLEPFDADAQAKSPDRQLAQIKQGVSGRERNTVVAADVGRQAALLKKALQYAESVVFPGRGKSLAGEQKAAGVIGDGQRIAVLPIAEQELAFVIGASQFVGPLP
jgi:hypothetical protein